MKKLWIFLGALMFATQAYCIDSDEFMIENASSKTLYVKFDNKPEISCIIEPGKREFFKKESSSLEDKDKINLSIYFEKDASISKTFEIKYPPAGKTITITEAFRHNFPNFIGSNLDTRTEKSCPTLEDLGFSDITKRQ